MDIDIALLPSCNIVEKTNELKKTIEDFLKTTTITFSDVENIPHLSLYQFRIRNDAYDEICNIIKNIPCFDISFSMDTQLEIVGKNIFWSSINAKSNEELNSLHQYIVNSLKGYRDKLPLAQIRNTTNSLNPQQISLINEFGVYWGIPGLFEPHITLIYNIFFSGNKKEKSLISDFICSLKIPNMIFQTSCIISAPIGFHGNILKTQIKNND